MLPLLQKKKWRMDAVGQLAAYTYKIYLGNYYKDTRTKISLEDSFVIPKD